jgi:hypothetical protein
MRCIRTLVSVSHSPSRPSRYLEPSVDLERSGRMAEPLGLFCLEGNRDLDRRYSGSIKPVIELLANMELFDQNRRPPIYSDVCTWAEVEKLAQSGAHTPRSGST